MIFLYETYCTKYEHPDPPPVGYVRIYSYQNSLWLMDENGDAWDLKGGAAVQSQTEEDQGVEELTAGTWTVISFRTAFKMTNYTVTPLSGLTATGDQVPVKVKSFTVDGFSAWAAKNCTFRWIAKRIS